MREHIVASSKAMRNGDWTKARDFIVNEKMNGKVWDLFYDTDCQLSLSILSSL